MSFDSFALRHLPHHLSIDDYMLVRRAYNTLHKVYPSVEDLFFQLDIHDKSLVHYIREGNFDDFRFLVNFYLEDVKYDEH